MSAGNKKSIKDSFRPRQSFDVSQCETEFDVTKLVNRIKSTAKDDIMKFLS